MATKFQRTVALVLSLIFILGCFVSGVSAADTTEMSTTSQAIEKAKELLGLPSYEEYAKKYSDVKRGAAVIEIAGTAYDTADTTALVGKTTIDGKEAIVVDSNGMLVYKFPKSQISESAKYTIVINYYGTITKDLIERAGLTYDDGTSERSSTAEGNGVRESKSTSIQRIFRLNGEIPFAEAYYMTLNQRWSTEYPQLDEKMTATNTIKDSAGETVVRQFRVDIDNNELRADINQTPAWSDYVIRDVDGFYKDAFEFVFEPKANREEYTLSFEGVSEPIAISKISLVPAEELPSYEEYIARFSGASKGTGKVRIEAEYPAYTSTNTIYPVEDRSDALTSPCDTNRTMLNTIGGDKWQVAMQTIAYKFKVDNSGLYTISPRYRQNINDGMYSSRVLKIYSDNTVKEGDLGFYNGVPFDEARELRFNYSTDWKLNPLQYGIITTDDKENRTIQYVDCEFYFEAGVEYTIEFEVALGTMADIVRSVDDSLTKINNAYLNIMKLTGADPDENRDYYFSSVMPDTVIDLIRQGSKIAKIADELTALSGVKSSNVATLEKVAWLLDRMGDNPEEEIAKNLSQLKSYIGSLGTWLSDAKTQPLQMDYILIQSAEEKLPAAKANFIQGLWHELKSFWASFFRNYDRMGASEEMIGNTQSIEVWMSSGRDQTQVMRNLINNDFTPSSNIPVDLKLIAGGTLLPSILAGRGPDVYVGLGDDTVINYAIRGALLEIEEFDGFTDMLYYKVDENYNTVYDDNGNPVRNPTAIFNDPAMFVLGIPDADNFMHYYGLPETQGFSMMFLRTDIMADLGIDCLDTWDDLREAATILSQNSMTIGLNNDYKVFLYQMGGTLFADGGMRINLDSNVALDSFETMCELFTQYSFPYKYDFVNRFRTGEMPIGIAGYNGTYNHLIVFATELRGLWEFVPLPGIATIDAEGNRTINNVAVSGISSIVMINGCENQKDSWEFMKWHSGDRCQINYSNEMVAILGDSAKHSTANIRALKEMPWTNKEYTNLIAQFNNLASIPNYPGAYIIGRYTKFAFLDAYNNMANPVTELLSYISTINKEITRKREEFGLETLELGETLASKRYGQIMDILGETGKDLNYEDSIVISDADKGTYSAQLEAIRAALVAIDNDQTFSAYCDTEYIDNLRNAGEALAKAYAPIMLNIYNGLSAEAKEMSKAQFEGLKNAKDGEFLTKVAALRDQFGKVINHPETYKTDSLKLDQIVVGTLVNYVEDCAAALVEYQASYPIGD